MQSSFMDAGLDEDMAEIVVGYIADDIILHLQIIY